MDSKRTGSCLCNAVKITVESCETDVGVCHCRTCRKWSGGPFFEVECGSNVSIEGKENVNFYQSSRSSERAFCKICGTHLYMLSLEGNAYGIPPGLFSNQDGFQFNRQVFIDQKPDYYSFSDDTKNIPSTYIYEHYPETRTDT